SQFDVEAQQYGLRRVVHEWRQKVHGLWVTGTTITTSAADCAAVNGKLQELWPDKSERYYLYASAVFTVCVVGSTSSTNNNGSSVVVGTQHGGYRWYCSWMRRCDWGHCRLCLRPSSSQPWLRPSRRWIRRDAQVPRRLVPAIDKQRHWQLHGNRDAVNYKRRERESPSSRIDPPRRARSAFASKTWLWCICRCLVGLVPWKRCRCQGAAAKSRDVRHTNPVVRVGNSPHELVRLAFIVKLLGASWTRPTDLKCVMELMDGGDLKDTWTNTRRTNFPWRKKYQHIHSIAEALVYLHSMNIIHRDLKSRNVLLDSTKGTKLTDFGISKEDIQATMTMGVGTFRWMAPEVLQDSGFQLTLSLGMLLSEFDTHHAICRFYQPCEWPATCGFRDYFESRVGRDQANVLGQLPPLDL
ncbi:serine/threonine protein kinase, partial [Aphanomyces euteiches]